MRKQIKERLRCCHKNAVIRMLYQHYKYNYDNPVYFLDTNKSKKILLKLPAIIGLIDNGRMSVAFFASTSE